MVTCKIKHFYNILSPRHSRGKSAALKHFCKCFILHVTTVLETGHIFFEAPCTKCSEMWIIQEEDNIVTSDIATRRHHVISMVDSVALATNSDVCISFILIIYTEWAHIIHRNTDRPHLLYPVSEYKVPTQSFFDHWQIWTGFNNPFTVAFCNVLRKSFYAIHHVTQSTISP